MYVCVCVYVVVLLHLWAALVEFLCCLGGVQNPQLENGLDGFACVLEKMFAVVTMARWVACVCVWLVDEMLQNWCSHV